MKALLFFLYILITTVISAQLPGFDIYLMDLPVNGSPATPVNITNHPGYDNQPSFSGDGKYIYYSSFYDTIQSDIYKYDLKKKTTIQVTHNKLSEFSPEMTPDKKHISVVRVEENLSQRFCVYDLTGANEKLFLDKVDSLAYYGRLDNQWVAICVLPEPMSLEIANLETGYQIKLDNNVGRCIKKIPGETKFSYITKPNDSVWVLNEAHIYQAVYEAGNVTEISKIPAVSEDYVWSADGSRIYMARNAAIYYFDYKGDKQWHLYTDLAPAGIKKIYRLAMSPSGKKLAFVAEE